MRNSKSTVDSYELEAMILTRCTSGARPVLLALCVHPCASLQLLLPSPWSALVCPNVHILVESQSQRGSDPFSSPLPLSPLSSPHSHQQHNGSTPRYCALSSSYSLSFASPLRSLSFTRFCFALPSSLSLCLLSLRFAFSLYVSFFFCLLTLCCFLLHLSQQHRRHHIYTVYTAVMYSI